jgi:hypothetical protein
MIIVYMDAKDAEEFRRRGCIVVSDKKSKGVVE